MGQSYTIEQQEKKIPVAEVLRDCVDVPYFLELCKACPNYGNRWACPPYTTDSLCVWLKYDVMHMMIRVIYPDPDMTEAEAIAMVDRERQKFSDELLEMEAGRANVVSLAAGPCMRCGENCTRREKKICRMPQKVRFSIESLGGNVTALMDKYFGRSMLWMKDGKVPEYFVLAGGLLLETK